MKCLKRLLYVGWLVALVAASPVRAEEGKELFDKQCAGCHSVGGGDRVGPDLKGVTARRDKGWLVRVIVEPDRLTAEKDPTQAALVNKYHMQMPKLGVSRDDAEKIVAYLGSGAPSAAAPEQKKAATAATPQLVARGRALFTGALPFSKGGPPCAACHRLDYPGISGGTLGANLTGLYGRMGEAGVAGILSTLQFPVMKDVFADRPLSEDERAALLALWQDAGARPAAQPFPFVWAGLGLFVLFLLLFALYKGRIG